MAKRTYHCPMCDHKQRKPNPREFLKQDISEMREGYGYLQDRQLERLRSAGYSTLDDVVKAPDDTLAKLKHFGPATVEDLREFVGYMWRSWHHLVVKEDGLEVEDPGLA
jgi:hypothetical protein